jgi:hypothetical protein
VEVEDNCKNSWLWQCCSYNITVTIFTPFCRVSVSKGQFLY